MCLPYLNPNFRKGHRIVERAPLANQLPINPICFEQMEISHLDSNVLLDILLRAGSWGCPRVSPWSVCRAWRELFLSHAPSMASLQLAQTKPLSRRLDLGMCVHHIGTRRHSCSVCCGWRQGGRGNGTRCSPHGLLTGSQVITQGTNSSVGTRPLAGAVSGSMAAGGGCGSGHTAAMGGRWSLRQPRVERRSSE